MNDERFQSLLSRAFDNDLSAEEFAEFEQHLASSAAARSNYLDFANLHNLLDLELQMKTSVQHPGTSVVDVNLIIRRQNRRSMRIAAMAAAAVIVLSMLGLRAFMISERAPTLSFQAAPDTRFTLTHANEVRPAGAMTMRRGSRLHLSQGTLELTFASGVKAIVSAPSDIRVHDKDTLFLNQGTAWFEVPQQAIGFTVKTRNLSVVDLGTEFGVRSQPRDHDEVHVFKGKVRVDSLGLHRESTTLVANKAVRSDHSGRIHAIPSRSSAFLTSFLPLPPYLHWSFDEQDGFEVKGSHPAAHEMTITPSPEDSPPQLVDGKFGSALSLDGNQQSLVTDWDGMYGAGRPLSCALWVRIPEGLDLTHYAGVLGWGIPGNSNAKWKILIRHDTIEEAPTLIVAIGEERGMHHYRGETRLDDNQWHHIAVVHNGRAPDSGEPDITLYVDGEREKLTHYHTPVRDKRLGGLDEIQLHPETRPMAIGKGPVPQDVTFRGLIDELYIFEGALSQDQMKQLITPPTKEQP